MNFVSPIWLYVILPIFGVLTVFFIWDQRMRRKMLQALIAPNLMEVLTQTYSKTRSFFKALLFALAILFILVSLARPQLGYTWEEQQSRGIDIIFALDTSKSMLAEDIRPNRLERSKLAIQDLLQSLDGDRVGLIAFAGKAFLQCPLTLDYDAFRQTLDTIDTNTIERGGTNLAAAIKEAKPTFAEESNFKFIILITDGEDLEEKGLKEARKAAKEDITVYTVGVGTQKGELIPITDANGSTDFARDPEGNVVKTRLDETTLKAIASATGGFYVPLGVTGNGLEKVYNRGLNTLPKQELTSKLRKVPIERFQWFLWFAIFFLTAESLISKRKRRTKKLSIANFSQGKAALLIIGVIAVALLPSPAEASGSKGYELYNLGDYQKASEHFYNAQVRNQDDQRLSYNLGNSLYREDNFEGANHAYFETLASEDIELQQQAFYNLGNVQYRIGELALETNTQDTLEHWERAVKHYESAIDLDEADTQAHENAEFVKKKIEELKKQQEEEQKNEDQNQDQDQNEDQKNQQDENKDQQNEQEKEDKEDQGDANEDEKKDQQQQKQPDDPQKKEEEQQPQERNPDDKMTKEEAQNLLEALKHSEKKLPSGEPVGYQGSAAGYKDW